MSEGIVSAVRRCSDVLEVSFLALTLDQRPVVFGVRHLDRAGSIEMIKGVSADQEGVGGLDA